MKKFIIITVTIIMNMGIENLVSWIDKELANRSWSYSELARRANVSQSMVSKVMSFSASPGFDFCSGIAKAFHVSPEVVLRLAGLLPAQPDETALQREMRYLFDQLDEQAQGTVITMLRGYVRETSPAYKHKTRDT